MATAQLFTYNESSFNEQKDFDVKKLKDFDSSNVHWLNVYKLNSPEMLHCIFDHLNIHRIVREDILGTDSRPGFHEYEGHSFFYVKSILPGKKTGELKVENISFVFSEN